jgi:hypothetical protein
LKVAKESRVNRIEQYQGNLLNHIEALYRPGERDLALALVEALGCSVSDTGFSGDGPESFLAIHPNPSDPDIRNNAFYISPMRPEQQVLEANLARLARDDGELRNALEGYRGAARTLPFGVSHFGLRYVSEDALKEAFAAVGETLSERLGDRLHLRIFDPEDGKRAQATVVQAFVYQDVIVSGSFSYGQLIELQGPPR